MEQQGDPLSEDKTEKLGDFMRRVKDDTVLNLYFVTEVISSGWTIHVDTKFDQAAFENA